MEINFNDNEDSDSYENSDSEMDNNSGSDSSFEYIDGRKISKKNHLPADDEEVTREQVLHYLMKYFWQTDFSSPIEESLERGAKVLDVGCGPGTWLLEMASGYPKSEFTGIDILEVFPTDCMPRNADFQKADVLKKLPFEDNYFDYIFMRFIIISIPEDKWKSQVLPELIRITKPGGWIELMESDCKHINEGPNSDKITNALLVSLGTLNINGRIALQLPEYLSSAPGIDKSSLSVKMKGGPLGKWGGKPGILSFDSAFESFKSMKPLITKCNPEIDGESYDRLLEGYVNEIEEYKTSWVTHRIFARKSL